MKSWSGSRYSIISHWPVCSDEFNNVFFASVQVCQWIYSDEFLKNKFRECKETAVSVYLKIGERILRKLKWKKVSSITRFFGEELNRHCHKVGTTDKMHLIWKDTIAKTELKAARVLHNFSNI